MIHLYRYVCNVYKSVFNTQSALSNMRNYGESLSFRNHTTLKFLNFSIEFCFDPKKIFLDIRDKLRFQKKKKTHNTANLYHCSLIALFKK